jgi:hypothetical protein
MPLKARQQAETVGPGGRRSPPASHGKEGVSGSSPEEGSTSAAQMPGLSLEETCTSSSEWSLWSLHVQGRQGATDTFGLDPVAVGGRGSPVAR